MDLLHPILFTVGLLLGFVVGMFITADGPVDDDWPDSTLDVMSHVGDTRPVR